MSMDPLEMKAIQNYLNDAILLNQKIVVQIDYLINCIHDANKTEGEKIRRSCKQLHMVSSVLKDIMVKAKKHQTLYSALTLLKNPAHEDDQNAHAWVMEERMKKQISEEIFHSIGQTLFGLYLSLNKLSELELQDQQKIQLDYLQVIIDETINHVKDVAIEIYPLIIEDLGIVPAIHSYLNYLSKKEMMDFTYKVEGSLKRYSCDFEIQLFRLNQELLHYITNYTDTSHLTIAFNEEDVIIQIKFTGNGNFNSVENWRKFHAWERRIHQLNANYQIQQIDEVYKIEVGINMEKKLSELSNEY